MSIKKLKNKIVLYTRAISGIKPIIETHEASEPNGYPYNCYKLNYIISDDFIVQVFLKEIPDLDKYNAIYSSPEDMVVDPFELSITIKDNRDTKIIKETGFNLAEMSNRAANELMQTDNYYKMNFERYASRAYSKEQKIFVDFINLLRDISNVLLKEGE